ncbi:MAG: DUF488 domain-containing protein [Syntrophorhabdales bacterium]
MIKVKRIYDSLTAEPGDGRRVLVDRLWPRGLRKDDVFVDEWMKELAPSTALRKWFSHDPAKWEEFKKRYRQELNEKTELFEHVKTEARYGNITILYSAKDREHNNAVALKEFLS